MRHFPSIQMNPPGDVIADNGPMFAFVRRLIIYAPTKAVAITIQHSGSSVKVKNVIRPRLEFHWCLFLFHIFPMPITFQIYDNTDAQMSSKFCGKSLSVKNIPNMPPQRVVLKACLLLWQVFQGCQWDTPLYHWSCHIVLLTNKSNIAKPARIASGLPDNVPAWYTPPSGAMHSMISRLPPNAPTGRPAPIILPNVVKSGVMPKCACAPPNPTRNLSLLHQKSRPRHVCYIHLATFGESLG